MDFIATTEELLLQLRTSLELLLLTDWISLWQLIPSFYANSRSFSIEIAKMLLGCPNIPITITVSKKWKKIPPIPLKSHNKTITSYHYNSESNIMEFNIVVTN